MISDETREEAVEVCGCEESVALRAEVERLRVELGRIAYYFSRPTPDEAFVQDIARSALSPQVPHE